MKRPAKWPQVRYVDAEGVSIAYATRGDGPIDLIRVSGMMGSILAGVVDPAIEDFCERLSAFSRLITLDRRGMGMSDPLVAGAAPPLEQQASDIAAVMDAVGSRRAAFWATADGSPVAILFAAMFPSRVSALLLRNGRARTFRADDYPIGSSTDDLGAFAQRVHDRWGDVDRPWGYSGLGADRRSETRFRTLYARVQQVSSSRAAAAAAILNMDVDVRTVLSLIQAPTLVTHSVDANDETKRHSRYLAEHIPNARLACYSGVEGHAPRFTLGDYSMFQEFLTGTRPTEVQDRILASVLFTDIVRSTELATELGDQEWRQRLDAHDAMVRSELDRFLGREVKSTGDGFFAVFDGPARAVGCAQSIVRHARDLGLEIRAGIHTGECDVRGDDYGGIAVHIGARVASLAGPGEVFTTRTVRDLVAGSGIEFVDRGIRELKGLPDPWHILQAK